MCYAVVTAAYVKLFVNPIEFTGTFGLLKKLFLLCFLLVFVSVYALVFTEK